MTNCTKNVTLMEWRSGEIPRTFEIRRNANSDTYHNIVLDKEGKHGVRTVAPQNVIIDAKCNINQISNHFLRKNVILTENVIALTLNVIIL